MTKPPLEQLESRLSKLQESGADAALVLGAALLLVERYREEKADCAAEHPPEPWAADLQAENAALRQRAEKCDEDNARLTEQCVRLLERAERAEAAEDLQRRGAKLAMESAGVTFAAQEAEIAGLRERNARELRTITRLENELSALRVGLNTPTIVELRAEIARLRQELACPSCGCSTPEDAERNECGCDMPVCRRDSALTLAQWYARLEPAQQKAVEIEHDLRAANATLREDVRRKDAEIERKSRGLAAALVCINTHAQVGGSRIYSANYVPCQCDQAKAARHANLADAPIENLAALAPKPETQANEELFGDTSAPNWATPPKSDSIQRGDHWQIGVAGICNVVRFDGDDITGVAHFLRIDDARMAVELQNRHAEDTSPTTSITRCQERRWGLSGNVLVNPEALHPENQNPAARPNDRCIAISFVQKHASGAVIQQDRCGRPLPCAEHGGKR